MRNKDVLFPKESNEIPNFTPHFSFTKHPTPALDNQVHGGDVEYNDTIDDATDDAPDEDDEQDHDHQTLGDQIDDVSTNPPEVEGVRRSIRQRRPSTRYNPHDYVIFSNGGETESFGKA